MPPVVHGSPVPSMGQNPSSFELEVSAMLSLDRNVTAGFNVTQSSPKVIRKYKPRTAIGETKVLIPGKPRVSRALTGGPLLTEVSTGDDGCF